MALLLSVLASSSGRLALGSGQSQPAAPNVFLQIATQVKRLHFFCNCSSNIPEGVSDWLSFCHMPISEPLTVTSEMECSDWPGLYHASNLVSRIGSAPPKPQEMHMKSSLNKIGAQFLEEGMRASLTRGVLSMCMRHSCGWLCLEPCTWAPEYSCSSAVAATDVVLGWETVAAPGGR